MKDFDKVRAANAIFYKALIALTILGLIILGMTIPALGIVFLQTLLVCSIVLFLFIVWVSIYDSLK